MANYFYVKSGGELGVDDDTPFSAEQNDSFVNIGTANYYDSIAAVTHNGTKTNSATDGDFVLVSDIHNKSHDFGIPPDINLGGTVDGAGLQIISVDDADSGNYKPGAHETLTDITDDFSVKGHTFFSGVELTTNDDVLNLSVTGMDTKLSDCTLNIGAGTTDSAIRLIGPAKQVTFTNVDVIANNIENYLAYFQEGIFIWDGGSLTGSSLTQFFATFATSENTYIHINGITMAGSAGQIMPNTTTATRHVLVKLTNCLLHADVDVHGTFAAHGHRFEMYNCDDTAGVQHRFEIADFSGVAVHNDSVYVTDTQAWYEGSDKSSIAVTTTANCNESHPFVFELPAQYVDLGVSDVITLDIVTATALTAGDICAFLVYPDGTAKLQSNWVSSTNIGSGYYGHDPMTAAAIPSTLPAPLAAGDWTNEPGSPLFYRLNLDTSIDVGSATAISIRIEVYKASITAPLYINPIVRLS